MIVEYATKTVENLVASDWNATNPVSPEMSALERESLHRTIREMDAVQGLALETELQGDGVVEIRVSGDSRFPRSQSGQLSGGVLLSLLDCSSTAAAMAVLGTEECGLTRLATSFVRPFATPVVTTRAWVRTEADGSVTTRAIVCDADGPVAVAEGTVVDLRGLAARAA